MFMEFSKKLLFLFLTTTLLKAMDIPHNEQNSFNRTIPQLKKISLLPTQLPENYTIIQSASGDQTYHNNVRKELNKLVITQTRDRQYYHINITPLEFLIEERFNQELLKAKEENNRLLTMLQKKNFELQNRVINYSKTTFLLGALTGGFLFAVGTHYKEIQAFLANM